MKRSLLASAMTLMLAGCGFPLIGGDSSLTGFTPARPPVASDIVDVKAGVPACPNTDKPPYAEDILTRYYGQHFASDEHEAAERFLKPHCFFTNR